MKRILALLLALIIVLSFSACGKEKAEKYCSNCGEAISKNVAFCEHCGEAVKETGSKIEESETDKKVETSKPAETSKPTESSKPAVSSKQTGTSSSSTTKPTTQTHKHTYSNYKCTGCGNMDINGMYNYFKDWVINNGTLKGDYVCYSKSADTYGGYSEEDFSLYYWADTKQIEFCLHSVLDAEYSINFYIYVPQKYSGNYEYITSYYYRETGESVCESKGSIEAKTFTKKHPLDSNKYIGPTSLQNDFMEMSRQGICDALDCLKQFLQKERMGYTLSDLGFKKY
ncbi:MAG: zinc ribbon domain-containing protein [Oscillospiraceae bacterium]|nr:zinc ribbon domain-containing protein [Oscillospiraceae bacterium]